MVLTYLEPCDLGSYTAHMADLAREFLSHLSWYRLVLGMSATRRHFGVGAKPG